METGYQRGKIQEESMFYEHKKHDGSYPIIGVNTFRNPRGEEATGNLELARSTEEKSKANSNASPTLRGSKPKPRCAGTPKASRDQRRQCVC